MLLLRISQDLLDELSSFTDHFYSLLATSKTDLAKASIYFKNVELKLKKCHENIKWLTLKKACEKMLALAKTNQKVDWNQAAKNTCRWLNKAPASISGNAGVSLRMAPESTETTPDSFDKTTQNENVMEWLESLATSHVEPVDDGKPTLADIITTLQHQYRPQHYNTNTDHKANNTINQDNLKKEGQHKNFGRADQPNGTTSTNKAPHVREAHTPSTPHRSVPLGIRRSKPAQAAIDRLQDPYQTTRSRDLTKEQQFALSCIFAANDNGTAFQISFSPKRKKQLINLSDNKAAKLVNKWLDEKLKYHFGRTAAYSFKFEVSSTNNLHIHGVICLNYSGLSEQEKSRLRLALSKVGGVSMKHRGAYIEGLYDGLGFYGYLTKDERKTKLHIDSGQISYLNRSMGGAVKQLHAANRQRQHYKAA